MIVFQTIGSIDMPNSKNAPYSIARKLPAPKMYVAIVVLWSTLHLLADIGKGRAASIIGWVLVLSGMTVGPFGTRFVGFVQTIAQQFSVNPNAQDQTQTAPPTVNG